MNAFAGGSGIDFVLAFVARVFLAIGRARQTAQVGSLQLWQGRKPTDVWFLAMVLSYWYSDQLPSDEAQAMSATFGESGLASVTNVLNLFSSRLLPFVQTAYKARSEPELDEAAVYFNAALEQIGIATITTALQSPKLAEIGASLTAKMPLPAEIENAYLGRTRAKASQPAIGKPLAVSAVPTEERNKKPLPPPVGPTQATIPKTDKQTRGERFDRADRDRAKELPPVPRLAPDEVLVAHLYMKGWTPEQIETIRRGPKKGIA